jgi:uncharacterized protein YjbI with pentapeptide repeats
MKKRRTDFDNIDFNDIDFDNIDFDDANFDDVDFAINRLMKTSEFDF